MLMKMVRIGGVSNVDEMTMDSKEYYHEFKPKMETFFYATRTLVSERKLYDIYGMVDRARKCAIEAEFEILYDDIDYSQPAYINGERIQIFQYDPPTSVLLYRLLNCFDCHQAERMLKPVIDNHEDADELIELFGLTPLESDTLESKRRRIVQNCVGVVGATPWFKEFCRNYYLQGG